MAAKSQGLQQPQQQSTAGCISFSAVSAASGTAVTPKTTRRVTRQRASSQPATVGVRPYCCTTAASTCSAPARASQLKPGAVQVQEDDGLLGVLRDLREMEESGLHINWPSCPQAAAMVPGMITQETPSAERLAAVPGHDSRCCGQALPAALAPASELADALKELEELHRGGLRVAWPR